MNDLKHKLKEIMPPCMIFAGFLANSIGFVVFSRSFTRLRLRNLFRIIAFIDMINLVNFLLSYLEQIHSIRIRKTTEFSCRFLWYIDYLANSIAAWLLVYLSANRFASLKLNSIRVLFKKNGNFIILLIFVFNFGFYSVALANTGLNSNKTICSSQNVTIWMHLTNLCCLIVLTVLITLLNIHFVLKIKKQIISECITSRRLTKNIHYVITTVVMNFLFVLFYLPIAVVSIIEKNGVIIDAFSINILASSINGLHFYVLLVFNSFFRRECLVLFGITKKGPPPRKQRKNALVTNQIT
jgi:hypothetical protein